MENFPLLCKILYFLRCTKSHRYRKQTYGYQGDERGGTNWEIGTDIYTPLFIKQITNKDLLYSTGNSTQYSIMAYMRKQSKKEWIYIYIHSWFTLLYRRDKHTTPVKLKKKKTTAYLPGWEKSSCDRCCASVWRAAGPPRWSTSRRETRLWRHTRALHCIVFILERRERMLSGLSQWPDRIQHWRWTQASGSDGDHL